MSCGLQLISRSQKVVICSIGWLRISNMRYCYQTWQIHILLENEMLKNVNFIKIGPRLDMPIGRQSFATNTPMWNGATNKIQFFSNF